MTVFYTVCLASFVESLFFVVYVRVYERASIIKSE